MSRAASRARTSLAISLPLKTEHAKLNNTFHEASKIVSQSVESALIFTVKMRSLKYAFQRGHGLILLVLRRRVWQAPFSY